MLDLISFKDEFVSQCRSALFDLGAADMKIEERTVNKSQRGTLNGMLFIREGHNCAPTLYIEDYYTAYKAGNSIKHLSHSAVETAISSMETADMLAKETEELLGDPQRNLRVRLINRGRNKEYLKGIPCMELECGFVFVAEIGQGEYGAVITDSILEDYEMTIDELFDTAIENTSERYPAVLHDLGESVIGDPESCVNLLTQPVVRAPAGAGPGFVLTNSRYFWGAGALFYPGVMDRIHELLGGDFYVLPSSVHELILIPEDGQDEQLLARMVRSANRSVVDDSDILADDLFICESGRLRRVSYGGVIPPSTGLPC